MPGASFVEVDFAFDVDEFGTSAEWRAQPNAAPVTAIVLIDAPGALILDGIVSTDWMVTYRVALWPSVQGGDRVHVGSTIYEVREALALDDGLLARAALRRL